MQPKRRLPSPPYNPGVRDLIQAKRAWSKPLPIETQKRGFAGWHENGYLPHRDEPGLVQFVTFRLADAFPTELLGEWEHLFAIEDDREKRKKLEACLDKGKGQCHLRRDDAAQIVEQSLLFRHSVQYDLRAWAIMPNHVHILVQIQDVPLTKLIKDWKGYAAHAINKMLRRSGELWQDGYWDTYMRDADHETKSRRYIETNPVKAGLIAAPKNWKWSSARFRDNYSRLCLP